MENSLLRGSYEQKTLYRLLASEPSQKGPAVLHAASHFFSCLLSFTSLCTHGEPGMRVPNGPGKRRKIYKRWSSFKTLDSFRLSAPKTINRNAWQERKGDSSLHVWVLLSRREEAGACEGFCTSLAPFHCARTPWHYGKAGIEGGLRVGNFCCRGYYWPDKISEMPL